MAVESIAMKVLALTCWLLLVSALAVRAEDSCEDTSESQATISAARHEETGCLVHDVTSSYQAGQTTIRVLLPDHLDQAEPHRVLYVLPVERLDEKRWGDSLLEIKKHDLHNKHGLICVFPTFSHLPWYGDHPTDREIRQESHLLKVVVPFVDRTYPTRARPDGRLLVVFSKSGWGAFTLLLRNPDVFGKAAAWDAPLMVDRPDKYGMGQVFATGEGFEAYRIPTLLQQQAASLGEGVRLIHFGYDNFREHHESAHRLMDDLKIAHTYRDGPQRKHSWNSGWLSEAVAMLVANESVASPSGLGRRSIDGL